LTEWLRWYNEERTHTGKYGYGKTPMQTLTDSLHLAKEKMLGKVTSSVLQTERVNASD